MIECEINRDLERGEEFIKEKVALGPNDSNSWIEYSNFCLRHGYIARAEECLIKVFEILEPNVPINLILIKAALLL